MENRSSATTPPLIMKETYPQSDHPTEELTLVSCMTRPDFESYETDFDYEKELIDKVLKSYAEAPGVNEREDFIEHAYRVVGLVRSYAGSLVPSEALVVAAIHDVVDRLINTESTKHTPERARAAKKVLLNLFTDPFYMTEDRLGYCSRVAADLVEVEKESGKHRIAMAEEAEKGTLDPNISQIISERYTGDIPSEAWRQTEPLLDFDHMRRFANKTNIEAHIIKACELLDNMQNPSSNRPSAWLQDVLEAESFYAPIMETLGLEGLATDMRGAAHIIRLENQGKVESIQSAKEMSGTISSVGIESIVSKVLGSNGDNCAVASAVHPIDKSIPVYIGEFAIDSGDNRVVAGNYRLKGVGSLANKIDSRGGKMPSDVVGLMVISEDLTSLVKDYIDFIANRVNQFEPVTAMGKKQPYYIQGSDEFIAVFKQEIIRRNLDIEIEYSNDSAEDAALRGYGKYEVAKVTFEMKVEHEETGGTVDVPVEVQFLTKQERKRARLGPIAHIVYKYLNQLGLSDKQIRIKTADELQRLKSEGLARNEAEAGAYKCKEKLCKEHKNIVNSAIETLESLYDRKSNFSHESLETNKHSEERGDAFLMTLAA